MTNYRAAANTKSEVIDVKTEGLWNGFFETGDPVCYLLVKKMEWQTRRDRQKENREGENPRPAD